MNTLLNVGLTDIFIDGGNLIVKLDIITCQLGDFFNLNFVDLF